MDYERQRRKGIQSKVKTEETMSGGTFHEKVRFGGTKVNDFQRAAKSHGSGC